MSKLKDDTPIFRIFNLYDLVNTLATKSIRLGQVARMEDTNELFGLYFDLLRSEFGPQTIEAIDESQRSFRAAQASHYMTCWTRVPENVAVWSLYSPHRDAIQISTTYGELRKAVLSHFDSNPYALAYKLEPNDPRDLFWLPAIGPVEYVDFAKCFADLKGQCEDYLAERDKFWDENVATSDGTVGSEIFSGLSEQVEQWIEGDTERRNRIFSEPRLSGPLLKDDRYRHEKEVRFVLSLKRRDGRSREEYEAHPMAGLDDPSRSPQVEDCPANVFVPFPTSNLRNFQIDGRIEQYKFEALDRLLSKFDAQATRNKAFREIEI